MVTIDRLQVAVLLACQRAQAAKFSNRTESLNADSDTAWMVLTKLRVSLRLTIATMAE